MTRIDSGPSQSQCHRLGVATSCVKCLKHKCGWLGQPCPTLPVSSPRVSERGLGDSASCLGDAASCTDDTYTPLTCGQTPYMRPLVQDLPWRVHMCTFQMISIHDIIVGWLSIDIISQKFKTSFYNSWRVQCPSQTNAGKWAVFALLPHHGNCWLYFTSRLLIPYCVRMISSRKIELNLCKKLQGPEN